MEPRDASKTNQTKKSAAYVATWSVGLLVVVLSSSAFVFAHQVVIRRQTAALQRTASLGPHVLVTRVTQSTGSRAIQIPATIHGYIETPVYAKVAGYMKEIRVDKGDRVTEGQVMAIIESPETDQQVDSALADYRLQKVTDQRDQYLVEQGVLSIQEGDVQHATMLKSKAYYDQQLVLKGYEVVTAPFDGIVTQRYFDPGALIPQSTSPTTDNPIVTLATLEPVRTYAYVPQGDATSIKDGDAAVITVTDYPGRLFNGTVTRHPEALDQSTRTMLVEVDFPNTDKALLPGMYAELKMSVNRETSAIFAPDDALVYRDDKVYLPLVRGNRIHLVQVTVGQDDGYRAEVDGDVSDGDLVALNVGQSVRDGDPVQPVMGRS